MMVDGFSGYTVVVPATRKGFTGAKAAKMMICEWIGLFGVPSMVITDMGAQFVLTWWKTMCSRLGVRRAYSHVPVTKETGRRSVREKS